MSETSQDFDPRSTLGLWIPVPAGAMSPAETGPWAAQASQQWGLESGADESTLRRVAAFLEALVAAEPEENFAMRLAFVVDPDFGAAVFDLALSAVDPRLELSQFVSSTDDPRLSRPTPFEFNGIEGVANVELSLDGADGDTERGLLAAAHVALVRDVPPHGETLILARSHTKHLDALSPALIPLQYLLTSDELLELVAGTS